MNRIRQGGRNSCRDRSCPGCILGDQLVTDSPVVSVLGVVLILLGLACIIAAVVGGGLSLTTRPIRIELPQLPSALRQGLLASIFQ